MRAPHASEPSRTFAATRCGACFPPAAVHAGLTRLRWRDAGRKVGEINSRLESQIGKTAALAVGAGGAAGDGSAPPRPLTLDEKLRKIKELRTSSGKAINNAVQQATHVSSFDADADHGAV